VLLGDGCEDVLGPHRARTGVALREGGIRLFDMSRRELDLKKKCWKESYHGGMSTTIREMIDVVSGINNTTGGIRRTSDINTGQGFHTLYQKIPKG